MAAVFLKQLDELRTELVELAFTLERRGRLEAADVALTTSARVGEIHEELSEQHAVDDRGSPFESGVAP